MHDTIVDLLRNMLWVSILLSAPVLVTALVIVAVFLLVVVAAAQLVLVV